MTGSTTDPSTTPPAPRGPQLTDGSEQLFRQVHPSWIQAGKPTSQAFRPTPKDKGLLSVSRSAKTSASEAFELHTRVKGLESAGVWGFLVSDCSDAGLAVYADPVEQPIPDPAHSVVDFRHLSDKEARGRSQILKAKAEPIYVRKADDR
ncbi:MAG TPA: hypothetical protein VIK91_22730 [Nannocystis sp.]